MQRDYSPFCDEGSSWFAEYMDLQTGVELHSVTFTPSVTGDNPAVLFIPGLVSIIENFGGTLRELTRSHKVVYVETREKGTARITGDHTFSVGDMTADIVHFAENKFPEGVPYVMAGYSLGATIIAEAFSHLKNKPLAIILIEPNASFPFSGWLRLLSKFAQYIYKPLKPFLKWYMRTFVLNIREDNEMYLIYCRNLDAASPERLGAAVRQLSSYRMNACLPGITVPAMVAVASKDRLHNHDEGAEIASRLQGAYYLDMADNRRTHGAEMALEIENFISSQVRRPVQADPISQDISSQPS